MGGATCWKASYDKRAKADRAAKLALKNGARPMTAYQCVYCKQWHLTSQKSFRRN